MGSFYKLIIAYDGTRFSGFQRQTSRQTSLSPDEERPKQASTPVSKRPRVDQQGRKQPVPQTIQECLEKALSQVANTPITIAFAGRTDKGVHARGQVATCALPDDTVNVVAADLWMLRKSINSRLPDDISVDSMTRCDPFDARHDVKCKQYSYMVRFRRTALAVGDKDAPSLAICHSGHHTLRSALDPPNLWCCPWSLADDQLPTLCQTLQGRHDFAAFVHKDDRNRQRHDIDLRLMQVQIIQVNDGECSEAPIVTARFVFQAAGFRRSLIRNLVGFCVDLCRGCVIPHDWPALLWQPAQVEQMAALVHAAPACGLCLDWVTY